MLLIWKRCLVNTRGSCTSFGSAVDCATCVSAAPTGHFCSYMVLCDVACRRVGQKHKCGGCGLHGINMGVCDREAPAGVLLLRGQAMAHNVSNVAEVAINETEL